MKPKRRPQLPWYSWVVVAFGLHLLSGGGALETATYFEDQDILRSFSQAVLQEASNVMAPPTFELLMPEDEETPSKEAETENDASNEAEEKAETPTPEEKKELPKEAEKPKEEAKKPPPPKEPKPEPKPEEKSKTPAEEAPKEKPPEEEAEKPKPPAPDMGKIAVQQKSDPNQKDNPNAAFLASEANTVEEETIAKNRSSDGSLDEAKLANSQGGPPDQAGDSQEDKAGQDETSPGDPSKAPIASAPMSLIVPKQASRNSAVSPPAPNSAKPAVAPPSEASGSNLPKSDIKAAATAEAGSDLLLGEGQVQNGFKQNADKSGEASAARKSSKQLPPRKNTGVDLGGLGSESRSVNGMQLNLSATNAMAAIGQDKLAREVRESGERRKAQHRGSWNTAGIDQWRGAIENYIPSVKEGNKTSLNAARAPFAAYLAALHQKLHPVFADRFLSALDNFPADHPMNRPELVTYVEIILNGDTGQLVRLGVTQTSGVTAYDVQALAALKIASPYGPPPAEIKSPGGYVYLHWEFHREPQLACSTYFARPIMLKSAPDVDPAKLPGSFPGSGMSRSTAQAAQPPAQEETSNGND